jgi:hypothetical protein
VEGAVDNGIAVKQHQKRLFHSLIIAEWGGFELARGSFLIKLTLVAWLFPDLVL